MLDGEGHVVGIVTNKDVQARLPRGSISRDIVDALDALEKIQVAELMRKDPVTIRYHGTMPRAARVMVDKHVIKKIINKIFPNYSKRTIS